VLVVAAPLLIGRGPAASDGLGIDRTLGSLHTPCELARPAHGKQPRAGAVGGQRRSPLQP
jgi:hypothetical protein